jgi:cytochrome b subunit of formate dehydrogenase
VARVRPLPVITTDRVLRNGPGARRFHSGVYLITGFLMFSGLSLLGEGAPGLEALLGGHVAAAHWHRWIGFALIGLALLVMAFRPRASSRFLGNSVRFRRSEIAWFTTYPRFVLRPSRHSPARHDGHFDPGQRVMNVVIVLSFVVLSATGILLSFPQAFTPTAFAWSLRVHKFATWVLIAAVAGHVLVATGVLRAYRGVWRAMHRDGRVPAPLAHRLWPAWAEREVAGKPSSRLPPDHGVEPESK